MLKEVLSLTIMERALPVVIEFDESVTVFDYNFVDSSISFEKLLEIAISSISGDSTDVHTLMVRHFEKKLIENV